MPSRTCRSLTSGWDHDIVNHENTAARWQLPRGYTGFWDHGSAPLPTTDARAFAQLCFETARRLGGKVEKISPPDVTPNFHTGTIVGDDYRLAILCHRHLPLLALATAPADEVGAVTFVDHPDARTILTSQPLFRLLNLDELHTSLDLVDLSALATAELDQISHWEPHTVGELLFNYWD